MRWESAGYGFSHPGWPEEVFPPVWQETRSAENKASRLQDAGYSRNCHVLRAIKEGWFNWLFLIANFFKMGGGANL